MLAAMMEHPRLRNCRVAEHYGLQRAQSRLDADWLTLAEYVDSSGSDGWPVGSCFGRPPAWRSGGEELVRTSGPNHSERN